MNMPRKLARTAIVAVVTVTALSAASTASAMPLGTSYTFALDVAQAKAGLPGTDYGSVTLTQGLNKVDVNVTLANGFLFANTGVGAQFAFNLSSAFANAVITLDAATARNFVTGSAATYNVTPYGIFTEALLFNSSVKGGLSAQIGTSLNFSVVQTGITLDAFSSSTARNKGQAGSYNFAADVGYALTGKTGGVGADDHEIVQPPPPPPKPVPEPIPVALLGLGLGGIALARRRK
jgi:hypothetical protein